MYLSQQTYYRVTALDNRLGGAEQRLTDDLSELASSVAHLYSSLTKPLLDCALVGIALISFSSKMGVRRLQGKAPVKFINFINCKIKRIYHMFEFLIFSYRTIISIGSNCCDWTNPTSCFAKVWPTGG